MNRSFEEQLEKDGILIYTNVGTSMMPLLRQHKDIIIIKKPTGRLKKYDVPLYKRSDGKYILHRILKVRKNDYVICGDHRWQLEYGITDNDIVGVLSGFIRDGKETSVTNKKYMMYVHLWCDFFLIRAFILRVKGLLKRWSK